MSGPKFGMNRTPGMQSSVTAAANKQFYFGGNQSELSQHEVQFAIASDAVDAGNTGLTTTLRGGLVMMQRSTGLLVPYLQSGEVGTIIGILPRNTSMIREGVATTRLVNIVTRGMLRKAEILNLDFYAAAHLVARGFLFDQPLYNRAHGVMIDENKTTSFSATSADHGKRFNMTSGADTTVTLPVINTGGDEEPTMLGFEIEIRQVGAGGVTITTASASGFPVMAVAGSNSEESVVTNGIGQTMRFVVRYISGYLRYVLDSIGYF